MRKLASICIAAVVLAAVLAPVAAAEPGAPDAATAPAQTWVTLMSEGFEGTWPGSGWTVSDLSNDGFQRYWGKTTYKPHAGSYSAWPAAAGANAVNPATSVYPDNMNARMVFGPFDLSDALAAEIHFWLWTDIEVDYDWLYFGSSPDGTTYSQEGSWEGQLDWSEVVVDLTKYAGDPSVWVRWDFVSDATVGIGGAYIDDVSILKQPLSAPGVTITRNGSDIRLDWPANVDATSFEVWRGTNAPYFAPGATCTAPACTSVTTNYFVDAGGSGNTTNNTTYVVRAVKGSVKSALSNRAGEFDFSLTKGN